MRTQAREAVLKVLYARIINPDTEEGLKRSIFSKLSEEEFDFATTLLELIDGHEERIVSVIDENMQHYKENRLFPIDRSILMIAVAEMLYIDNIPAVVSVSEATDMAQKYSTEKSADFVNGVLSGVMKLCTK